MPTLGESLLQLARRVCGGGASRAESYARKRKTQSAKYARSQKRGRLGHASSDAQHDFVNREHLGMQDLQVTRNYNKPSSKGVGTGKWKQRTEHEILRVGFSKPSLSPKAISEQMKPPASDRYVKDVMFSTSSLVVDAQATNVSTALSDARFVIMQIVFDEAKFRLLLRGSKQKRANDRSVFAAHGVLVWSTMDLVVSEDELVLLPVNLERNSASHMWNGLRTMLPEPCKGLLRGVKPSPATEMIGVCPGCDHHPANDMLVHELEGTAPEHMVVLPGFCKQHDAGNTLVPMVKALNVINPGFCLAKRLRSDHFSARFRTGMYLGFMKCMRHMKKSEHPGWKPEEEHAQYAEDILTLAYYQRDFRQSLDEGADIETIQGQERKRREIGALFKKRFPGNWLDVDDLVFWDEADDARGEFSTREEAAWFAVDCCEEVGFHILGDPAINKWLSVYPLVCNVITMQAFHGLFLFALRYACNVQCDEDDALSDFSDGERIGSLSKSAWTKQERRRELKALAWAESKSAKFSSMLFGKLGTKVMRLHYKFFKYCQQSPVGTKKSLIFVLCDPEMSPVKEVVRELWALLHNGSDWRLLEKTFGPYHTWRSKWRQLARECVLLLIGQLNHRFDFKRSPFDLLVPLADPDASVDEKRRCAREIFQRPFETLHVSLRNIRKSAGSWEALLDDFWQSFLFHLVNKMPLSSALVECLFASFKVWLSGSKKAMSQALLQSKHLTSVYGRAQRAKQERSCAAEHVPLARTKRCRPVWIIKRGEMGRRSAYHQYIGEQIRSRPLGESSRAAFAKASGSFKAQCKAKAKASCKARAQSANKRTVAMKRVAINELNVVVDGEPSPWNISEGSKHPLRPSTIKEKLIDEKGGIYKRSAAWQGAVISGCLGGSSDFPQSVDWEPSILPCIFELSSEMEEIAKAFVAELRVLLAPIGVKDEVTKAILLTDSGTNKYCVLQCCSRWKTPTFRAEIAVYDVGYDETDDGSEWFDCPVPVPCATSVRQYTLSVLEFASSVVKRGGGPYSFQYIEADYSRGIRKGDLFVNGLGPVLDIAEERRRNLDIANCNRALRLLRAARLPFNHQPRKRIVTHSVGKKRAKPAAEEESDADTDLLFAKKLKATDTIDGGSDLESQSDVSSEPDTSSKGRPVALSSGIKLGSRPKAKSGDAQSLLEFSIGTHGAIKVDLRRKQFNAHCNCLGQPEAPAGKDHRTETTNECRTNSVAAKRPLAFLVAWLRLGFCFDNRSDHLAAKGIITNNDIEDARKWLQEQPELKDLLDYENLWSS